MTYNALIFPALTCVGSTLARAGVAYLLKADPKPVAVYTAVDMIVSNFLLKNRSGALWIVQVPAYRTLGIVSGLIVTWLTVGSVGILTALAMTISGIAAGKIVASPYRRHRINQLHIL